MKYAVFYDMALFGKSLNNKAGKDFKKNVEDVLGTTQIIWVPSDHTHFETIPSI